MNYAVRANFATAATACMNCPKVNKTEKFSPRTCLPSVVRLDGRRMGAAGFSFAISTAKVNTGQQTVITSIMAI